MQGVCTPGTATPGLEVAGGQGAKARQVVVLVMSRFPPKSLS